MLKAKIYTMKCESCIASVYYDLLQSMTICQREVGQYL